MVSSRRRGAWMACHVALLLESGPEQQLPLLNLCQSTNASAWNHQQVSQKHATLAMPHYVKAVQAHRIANIVQKLSNYTCTTAEDATSFTASAVSDGPRAKKSMSASLSQLSSPIHQDLVEHTERYSGSEFVIQHRHVDLSHLLQIDLLCAFRSQ